MILSNDRSTWINDFLKRNHKSLWSTVQYYSRSFGIDADDLYQDTAIRLLRPLKRASDADMRGYFGKACLSISIDSTRKNKLHICELKEWVPMPVKPQVEIDVSFKETWDVVVGNAKPSHLRYLEMHWVEGYTLQQISDEHSTSIGTIKTAVHRAKKVLRPLLSNYER